MRSEDWCLEDMWLNLGVIEDKRGKVTFAEEGDFYNMVAKCQKIINKALNVKGARRRSERCNRTARSKQAHNGWDTHDRVDKG